MCCPSFPLPLASSKGQLYLLSNFHGHRSLSCFISLIKCSLIDYVRVFKWLLYADITVSTKDKEKFGVIGPIQERKGKEEEIMIEVFLILWRRE